MSFALHLKYDIFLVFPRDSHLFSNIHNMKAMKSAILIISNNLYNLIFWRY